MPATATNKRRKTPNSPASTASLAEAEFRRWTPEQVVEMELLPYRTARAIREKCYRRELYHHSDGGRITFTAEDLRRNSELGAQVPLTIGTTA